MRLKSELYKNSIILYNLENDKDKIDKIMKLIPYIRKYFSLSYINAISNPKKVKRPWLSMIRKLTKSKYEMLSCDYRIKQKDIRTKKYIFYKK